MKLLVVCFDGVARAPVGQIGWISIEYCPIIGKMCLRLCMSHGDTPIIATKGVGLRISVECSLRSAFLEMCSAEANLAALFIRQFIREQVEKRRKDAEQELIAMDLIH